MSGASADHQGGAARVVVRGSDGALVEVDGSDVDPSEVVGVMLAWADVDPPDVDPTVVCAGCHDPFDDVWDWDDRHDGDGDDVYHSKCCRTCWLVQHASEGEVIQ